VFKTLLRRIAVGLADAGLPYMVFGGQAVLLYGEPRLTRDIDVTLGVDPGQTAVVIEMVQSAGLRLLTEKAEEFVRETLVLPAIEPESGIRIDFVFSLSQFERAAIERARPIDVDGVDVRFVSLEDLIVMKLLAGRPRDLEDVASVLRKNRGFDRSYVDKWLAEFDRELDTRLEEKFLSILADLT
jgi:predicted nucleotidyltransferase